MCVLCISIAGNGLVLMSIDNLPAQLPREATDYFGSRLLPFLPDMVQCSILYLNGSRDVNYFDRNNTEGLMIPLSVYS